MYALGYDGIQFADLDVHGGLVLGMAGPDRRPLTVNRVSSSPLPAGVAVGARSFTVTFTVQPDVDIQEAIMAILGALNADNPDEREFLAQKLDGTIVSCRASVGTYRIPAPNQVTVQFNATNPRWRKLARRSISGNAIGTAPSGVSILPVPNRGGTQVSPEIRVTPVTQRSGSSANCGWKYRQTVPITNGSTEDWIDEKITLYLGDTAALVGAGKALASGDDLRVRYQGEEFYRTLTCWNSPFSLAHVLVTLKAGASKMLEVWYGNPSATAPQVTLSTRTGTKKSYSADDLEGDSGTATNASTTSAITVSGKTWETNRWKDCCVGVFYSGGSVRWRRIDSNTGNVLTLNRALNTAPTNADTIVVFASGVLMDGGRVTTTGSRVIVDNLHTRTFGPSSLIGAKVTFHGGTANPSVMYVTANDATSFTLDDGAGNGFTANPTVGDSYTIQRYGLVKYVVDTAIQNSKHRGVYRENRYYEPPGYIAPGELTPFGWGPDTYLNNGDDFAAWRPYNVGSGGGHDQHWWPLPRMKRRVAQANKLEYEGEGDGFSITTTQPISGVYLDYQMQNELQVGKFVIAAREPGGSEQWRDVLTNSDLHANLTPIAAQHIDLTPYNNASRLGLFVLPYDGQEIPVTREDDGTVTGHGASTVSDSSKSWITDQWKSAILEIESASDADPQTFSVVGNNATQVTVKGSFDTQPANGDTFSLSLDTRRTADIEVRTNDTLELYLDLSVHPALVGSLYQISTEESIYDEQMELRLSGGSNAVLPYDVLEIGGRGKWLGLTFSETLRVDLDPESDSPIISILDNTGALVRRAQWAAEVTRYVADSDGNAIAKVPPQLFPLRPIHEWLANPSFTTDLTGWSTADVTGGVTVAVTQDSDIGIYHGSDGPGTMKFDVSAAPGGAWHAYRSATASGIPIRTMVETGFWARTSNVSLKAYIALTLVANGETVTLPYVLTLPATGAWYAIGVGLPMPVGDGLGSTGTATVTLGIQASGAVTGQLYVDDGHLGGRNLYIKEGSMGKQVVQASWLEGWHL